MADFLTQPKSNALTIVRPTFDKTMHQPPRIDGFGYNALPKMKLGDDGSNILKDPNIRIPSWWGDNSPRTEKKTRTELLAARRKEKMPDISFDLDGDGYVGGRDYVLSKMFDKDGDGKLNTQERKAADEAVRNVSTTIFKSF